MPPTDTSSPEGSPAPVVLVIGPEELLAERAVSAALAAVRAADPQADVRDLAPGLLELGQLTELTSPSLFGERRAVVVRGVHEMGTELAEELIRHVSTPADDVTLVLVHSGIANRAKAVVAAARSAPGARVVDAARVTRPMERLDFVLGEVEREGSSITEAAARALVDAVGTDLRELAATCAQLAADTEGRIDEAAVARYHRGRAEVSGFSVADRAVEGRTAEALEQLRWALSVGVAPVLVTSALAQGLRSIAKVGDAPRGLRGPELARHLAMPPWKVDRVREQLRGWTPDCLSHALRAVAVADVAVKGGGDDPGYALERAVVTVSRLRAGRT